MPYTYSSTAFLRSLVSSITRSCSAISNSSLTNCSRTAGGKPPTVEDTGTSIFLTFFFFSGTGAAASVSMGFSPLGSPGAVFSPFSAGGASVSMGASVAGAGSGTGAETSSSISSTACADSTETRPLRLRRTLTLSLVLPSSELVVGMGPTSKDPICVMALGGRSVGVVYLAWSVNVSSRKKVIILVDGTALLRSKSSISFTSPPSACHWKETG
mmetsp:Transcript_4488/g.20411  ORF Transcript_4488/g.20411 Transcript_4488/m.20411 type:complete len:214 (-) Transcript_4488:1367-2008(-)